MAAVERGGRGGEGEPLRVSGAPLLFLAGLLINEVRGLISLVTAGPRSTSTAPAPAFFHR